MYASEMSNLQNSYIRKLELFFFELNSKISSNFQIKPANIIACFCLFCKQKIRYSGGFLKELLGPIELLKSYSQS
jgi:hypothetical protein